MTDPVSEDDQAKALRFQRVANGLTAPDGSAARRDAMAALREIAERDPQIIQQLNALIELRKLGAMPSRTAH